MQPAQAAPREAPLGQLGIGSSLGSWNLRHRSFVATGFAENDENQKKHVSRTVLIEFILSLGIIALDIQITDHEYVHQRTAGKTVGNPARGVDQPAGR
jgi:hypothetical protein